jgi:hypothetical protein
LSHLVRPGISPSAHGHRLGATGYGFVALRLVYLIFIRLLGALALLLRSDISKHAEILVLRLRMPIITSLQLMRRKRVVEIFELT